MSRLSGRITHLRYLLQRQAQAPNVTFPTPRHISYRFLSAFTPIMSPTPPPSLHDTLQPPRFPEMKTLDRSAFTVRHPIVGVRVESSKISKIRTNPLLKGWMMDHSRERLVVDDPAGGLQYRVIRLKVSSEEDLPEDLRVFLKAEGHGFVKDEIVIDYDKWSAADILNSIIPAGPDGGMAPSAFASTGHIGHVNLRDEWIPYKYIIGEVFLDKNKSLRTIVNKLNSIHAQFRYFDMEVIAGEPELVTTLSESGCTFTLDFSKVYWNSRLQREHDRLVDRLQPGSVVVDAMAGVGPFAIPAAKKGCYVLGNDLNPESVRWMRVNQAANKVEKNLRITEIDGHEFIKSSARTAWDEPFAPFVCPRLIRRQAIHARKEREKAVRTGQATPNAVLDSPPPIDIPAPPLDQLERRLPGHYVMNLPDSALTFLGSFRGLYDSFQGEEVEVGEVDAFESKLEEVGLPLVHVYCFTREMELEGATRDICERASQYLGYTLAPSIDSYELHLVRRVAPNKDMYCLTFRLPREVAFTSAAGTAGTSGTSGTAGTTAEV